MPAQTQENDAAAVRSEIADVVALVRPEIRAEHAYRVVTEQDVAAKLDQNESPYDLPPEIKRAAMDLFYDTSWNRYPPDRPHELTQRLAAKLDWPREGLIVGRGSNELIQTIGLCLVSPGRRVVLPRPMFALFESIVRMHGGSPVSVAPEEDLSHRADAVIAAMQASRAPLTIVCSPNNPTGHAFSHAELTAMAEASSGVLLIDEAYVEFTEGPTALDLAREFAHVIVLRTMSKAMGLAGLRLGYLAGHPQLIAEMEKARLPFLVDRLSEAVAIAVLERDDLIRERVAEMKSERERVVAALSVRGDLEIIPSSANFFLLRADMSSVELQSRLLAEGVRVRNVTGYPELAGGSGSGRFSTGWVRASVGTRSENSDFLAALERVLS
jgi:histidinol-phosphate aminotransferase